MDIVERTCEPTKFDMYPQYTIMKVGSGPQEYGGQPLPKYFIQVGTNESPSWFPIGALFDNIVIHNNLYENKKFVQELIDLSFDASRPFTHLADLLRSYKRNS